MNRTLYLALLSLLLALSLRPDSLSRQRVDQASEAATPPIRRVNAPYNVPTNQSAIFWFGQVDFTSNHANVRVNYTDDELILFVHVFDRRVWFSDSPTTDDFSEWDAVSLFLALDGNNGNLPTEDTYHLIAQFSPPSRPRETHERAYWGNGGGWGATPLVYSTEVGYRGQGFNNGANSRGWWIKFAIPFDSLGLAQKPSTGAIWGLALTLHDRDDETRVPIPDQTWPESADSARPRTWGQLRFGLPAYTSPPAKPVDTVIIRHGVDGNAVIDGEVGGHSLCGSLVPSWGEWGVANYAGFHQINVQNQWDVADWPCYSKYFITFPLDNVPADQAIISAELILFQFGNAGQQQDPGPEPSFIQVFTVAEDWDEEEITWNNAPLAVENLTGVWVDPLTPPTEWPGVPREWDVTRAVAEAYAAGEPVRLALFSADTDYHSGRYFHSSDARQAGRPMLRITWGEPVRRHIWSSISTGQYD